MLISVVVKSVFSVLECPEIKAIEYGRVYGKSRFFGNRIGFLCNYGYTLIGSRQRVCLSDGTWSGTETRCVRGYIPRKFHGTSTLFVKIRSINLRHQRLVYLHNIRYILHNVPAHCMLIVYCTLYSVQYTLYSVLTVHYTIHYILSTTDCVYCGLLFCI